MIFLNYRDMVKDMYHWSTKLPQFSAICGVPRSGLIPATVLAEIRNCHMITLEDLQGERYLPLLEHTGRGGPGTTGPYSVLVLDDAVNSGNTMRGVRESLVDCTGVSYKFAAYLTSGRGVSNVDYAFYESGDNLQIQEWNVLHHPYSWRFLTDLDGVICEDWQNPGEEGVWEERYRKHVEEGKLLIKPSFPLRGIVTSRLEKWRPQTEAWLARHGVEYQTLWMNPSISDAERAATDGYAGWKNRVYKGLPDTILFIESDPKQAEAIAFRSEKPVLDWGNKKLLQYGVCTRIVPNTNQGSTTTVNKAVTVGLSPITLPV